MKCVRIDGLFLWREVNKFDFTYYLNVSEAVIRQWFHVKHLVNNFVQNYRFQQIDRAPNV